MTNYGNNNTITGPNGMVVNNAEGLGSTVSDLIDNNGNKITTTHSYTYSSGVYHNTDTYKDTLNTTALTVVKTSPESTSTYAYTAPSGASGTKYTFTYTNKSVRTNFGCSGITEYNASGTLVQVPLLTSISLPDGTSYSFSYEATPAHSGYVTGRIASVTLPTGGTISYDLFRGWNAVYGCYSSVSEAHDARRRYLGLQPCGVTFFLRDHESHRPSNSNWQ